ncbi:hypothetical protein DFP72DRAFT_1077894 [Ephemerocybe angulata]|uniref:F-box domain-containing protein n=1 Tax=Ephemerocybe angulata TaxID=980116 RepID=A0A8H6LW84_9AGAR|nr:hypothetical protein DFP72DRAFT_1077894 [Tulosesus angulatus]
MRVPQEVLDLICGEYACRGAELDVEREPESEVQDIPAQFPSARRDLATKLSIVSRSFYTATMRVVWEWVVLHRVEDFAALAEGDIGREMRWRTRRLDIAIRFEDGRAHEDGYDGRRLRRILETMPQLRVLILNNTMERPAQPWRTSPMSEDVVDAIIACKLLERLEMASSTDRLHFLDFARLSQTLHGLQSLYVAAGTRVDEDGSRSGLDLPFQAAVFPRLQRLTLGCRTAGTMPNLISTMGGKGVNTITTLRRIDIRFWGLRWSDECLGFLSRQGPYLETFEWAIPPRPHITFLRGMTALKTLILVYRTFVSVYVGLGDPMPNLELVVIRPDCLSPYAEGNHIACLSLIPAILAMRNPKLTCIRLEGDLDTFKRVFPGVLDTSVERDLVRAGVTLCCGDMEPRWEGRE